MRQLVRIIILRYFYEIPTTYPITSSGSVKLHGSTVTGDIGQVLNGIATLQINDFNAFSFGNGVESYRIRDDFNQPIIGNTPRVNSYIDSYAQSNAISGITYSQIYQSETSTNRLNEFNLSKANFKFLDRSYGSIQKLHSRDNDLVVFQENKVFRVLYEKNLLSDAVGGGAIASIPEVLGTPYHLQESMELA